MIKLEEIEKAPTDKLLKEFNELDSMIFDVGCYSVSDLVYHQELARELDKREGQ